MHPAISSSGKETKIERKDMHGNNQAVLSPGNLSRIRKILSSYHSNPNSSKAKSTGLPILPKKELTERSARLQYDKNHFRESAVLVPICVLNDEPCIIFTKRSSHMPTHRNQISFPGGHRIPNESLRQTALRETKEELGGNYAYQQKVEILGYTDTIPAPSGSVVTPVVAALTEELPFNLYETFQPDEREVADIFARSIIDLAISESAEEIKSMKGSYGPIFPGKEGKIWGLTAFILRPILRKVLIPVFYPDLALKRRGALL